MNPSRREVSFFFENLVALKLQPPVVLDPQIQNAMELAKTSAQRLQKERLGLGTSEGFLLQTLVALHQPKRVIEIGTLTGGSALWIASSLKPGATIWTIEKDENHHQAAAAVFATLPKERFRIAKTFDEETDPSRINICSISSAAEDALVQLQNLSPFDCLFLDGPKSQYFSQAQWASKHLRPGGLLIADNVFLGGLIWANENELENGRFSKTQVDQMKKFLAWIQDQSKFFSTLVPTPEGFSISVLRDSLP